MSNSKELVPGFSSLPQNGVSATPDKPKTAFPGISCLLYLFLTGLTHTQLQNSFQIGVLRKTGTSMGFSKCWQSQTPVGQRVPSFLCCYYFLFLFGLHWCLWLFVSHLGLQSCPSSMPGPRSSHPQPAAVAIAPCLTYLEQVVQVWYHHWKTFGNGVSWVRFISSYLSTREWSIKWRLLQIITQAYYHFISFFTPLFIQRFSRLLLFWSGFISLVLVVSIYSAF